MSGNLKKRLLAWSMACLVIFTLPVCLLAMGAAAPDAGPTAEELVRRYRQAVTCWDTSVAMRAEVMHSWEYRSTQQEDIRRWKYDTQHRRNGNRCEWSGRCQFEGELDGQKYSHTEQFRQVVGDDFVLRYGKRDSDEEPADAFMLSDVQEQRFMMQAQSPDGNFLQGRRGGIGSAQTMAQVMSECGRLRLVGDETLNGTSCFIVEAKTRFGTFTVWIAPEKGYNALKWIERKSAGDILRDDVHIEDQGITECVETVDNIEVKQIDGVFVPVSGRLAGACRAGDEWESTDRVTAERTEIVLKPDFRALDAFKISFPEGTVVTHRDIPGWEFRWTQGRFVPDMNAHLPRVLTGKPLPSFDGIVKGFDPVSAAGRVILVCLCDINQRPSRNCIARVMESAAEFARRDVVVIAIQASPMGQAELDKWTAEKGIPFAVGMTGDDGERTRARWGARSLPWLILTDRSHIVVGEGFAVAQLGERIQDAPSR